MAAYGDLEAFIWTYQNGRLIIGTRKLSYDPYNYKLREGEFDIYISKYLLEKRAEGLLTFLICIGNSNKKEVEYFVEGFINIEDIVNIKVKIDSILKMMLAKTRSLI